MVAISVSIRNNPTFSLFLHILKGVPPRRRGPRARPSRVWHGRMHALALHESNGLAILVRPGSWSHQNGEPHPGRPCTAPSATVEDPSKYGERVKRWGCYGSTTIWPIPAPTLTNVWRAAGGRRQPGGGGWGGGRAGAHGQSIHYSIIYSFNH